MMASLRAAEESAVVRSGWPRKRGVASRRMRIVVTGGAGFIGSHLADALVAREHEGTVVDHLRHGHEANLGPALRAGARLARADVTDVMAMRRILGVARPDVVFHLAAQID